MMRFGCSCSNEDSGSDASRCADELWCFLCTCAVVFHRKVEQMITMSLGDVTMIACATGGGKYIRKASLRFGLSSGFLALNGWVYC